MIGKKRCLLILLSLLFIYVSISYSKEYSFYKLSLEDGLSSNSVYRIEQDSTGYMWFGTFSGLNRYDGKEIKTYKPEPGNRRSISSPVIFDLYEDSQERLWIATDGGGLNLYSNESDDFTVFKYNGDNEKSISSNNVYAICEDSLKRLWFGTGGAGLNLYSDEDQTFSHYKASSDPNTLNSDIIRVLYNDSQGIMWIGTEGGGLSMFNVDGTFSNFHSDPDNQESISNDNVRSIFEDSSGNLWIGTEGGGLNIFDRDDESFQSIEVNELKSASQFSVRSINEDPDGNIWIGTEGQGICIIDKNGNLIDTIRTLTNDSSSLSKDKIRDIYIDRNGLIWIGTRDGGVNKYNPRTIGFKVDSETDIREIYEDHNGDLWIGTDGGGLFLVQGDDGQVIEFKNNERNSNSLSSNQVYSVLEDQEGRIWIGTDGGGLNLYNREDNSFTRFMSSIENPYSINSNTVWSLFEDHSGTLWIGTEGGGLNSYDPEENTFISYKSIPDQNDTLNGNSIRSIFEDSKFNLWIGTWDGGLNLFDREKHIFKRFTRDPDDIFSLSDSSVNTIFEDSSGNLWIGTAAGGLNKMDRDRETFIHFSRDEGFSGDNIFGIQEDGNKNLWVSTDRGLTKFNPGTMEILNFGEADGLLGNEFSVNASAELKSGELLFGGPKGINRFFPAEVVVNRKEPACVITDISIMNESISYSQIGDSQLDLTYQDSILSISFAVLDYAAPERNSYSVIMEGLQNQWTNLNNQNNIVYSSLPAGEYKFRVKGADNNGIWNEIGVFLNIKVSPPWWKTSIFYWSILLIFLLSIFVFIKMRLYRLELKNKELREYSIHVQDIREEERTSVAREVHDELGQTLSALKMEVFRIKGPDIKPIIELIDLSLESVKDLSTRLRPKVLDNLSLEEALSWLVRDFSHRSGISVVEKLDEKLNIDNNEIKTALFRITQEILTNVIRHSKADKVVISLTSNNGSIILKIIYNGCGFAEDSFNKERSFGIRGMKERCRHLNGQFTIVDVESGGTEIQAIIPVLIRGNADA